MKPIKKMTLQEYTAAKAKAAKKRGLDAPLPVKIFLLTPFLIIFCFGVFYIPVLLFQVATSKPDPRDKGAQLFSEERDNNAGTNTGDTVK